MKPKDLKNPFPWKERKILLHDRILYVPDYLEDYGSYVFPGFEHPDCFGNQNPVRVEYCSGNGAWIAEKAAQFPDINWIAVELRFDRVRKIWSKLKNRKLNNLLVICGEGHLVTTHYFPSSGIDQAFINFPDPWPKNRHAKHRIIKPDFVGEVLRVLKKDGMLTMVTDDPDYSQLITETLRENKGFSSLHPAPFYATEIGGYGSSYFDQLWRGKGRKIHYHQYIKEQEA